MTEITVKHYRRVSAGASEKELITERVTAGSETSQFLRKMEARRILRPCFETIDMRGKVPGECRKYVLNNRIFFLDDTSYGIYQQGLKAHNGMYTVATYEAIVNGKHTNRAIREAQQAQELVERRKQAGIAPHAATGERDEPAAERQLFQPERVPFGYFKKRREDRLQYVTAVEIEFAGKSYTATTRDISVRGLQITLKGIFAFPPGADIAISFPTLQEQNAGVGLSNLSYRVIDSEQRDAEHQLRVQFSADQPPADFADFIVELIERFKRKYKLDVEDDFWSVCSWLYERIYSESLMQLSFFVGRDDNDRLSMQTVAVTDGNQPLAQFFRNDVDNYDFSPLGLPSRLLRLRSEREIMLMMYREKVGDEYRLHSAADFEMPDASALEAFLRFTLAHEEHCVVKVVASGDPLREISPKKFEMLTGRLLDKAQDEVAYLREKMSELVFTGTVIDITTQMQTASGVYTGLSKGQIDVQGLQCWVGAARKQLPLYQETERVETLVIPELVRFGYVERRREDRYLAETSVEITTAKGRGKGRTRDISKRGLAIRTEENLQFEVGDELKVGLISLQAKRPSLDLSSVPYRVVKVEKAGSTTVMLERMRNKLEYEIDDFFVELITKNKHKLAVDINDTRGATLSRVYEGTASENAVTVPFFISREEQGGGILQKVAVPEGECALADYFRDPSGRPDFSWLTDSRLVLALYQQMVQMARQSGREQTRPSPVEIEVYCCRVQADTGAVPVLKVMTELEFADDNAREAFVSEAIGSGDLRVIKLMATYTLELNKLEMDNAIDSIRSQSRHRALKLQEQLHAVVGYGELIDITAQFLLARSLSGK